MDIRTQWSDKKLAQLSYRLSYLLESGIPLLDSLDLILEHFSGREKVQLQNVRRILEEGQSLSKAITCMTVPPLFVSLIIAGEQHGQYASSFSFASRYYRERANWKHKLTQLVSYPVLLCVLSVMSLWFLFTYILPQIGAMYSTLNLSLPRITRIVVKFFSFFSSYGFPFISTLLLGLGCFLYLKKKEKYAVRITRWFFTIPMLNHWLKMKYSHYFSMQIGLLLEAGISILHVCRLFHEKAPWPFYRELMGEVEVQLHNGSPLSQTLMKRKAYFTVELIKYVELGEEGGQVGQCLLFYSRQAEEEIKQKIEKVLRWLEPCILLTIGGIVLLVVLSFFLPVLHMIHSLN